MYLFKPYTSSVRLVMSFIPILQVRTVFAGNSGNTSQLLQERHGLNTAPGV